jgi:tetratricopeptide (TPR) repeat protein
MKRILTIIFVSFCLLGFSQEGKTIPEIEELHNRAIQIYRNNADSAIIYAKQALAIAKQHKSNKYKAFIYITLSDIYHRKKDLNKAFEFVELAEIVASEVNDTRLLARAKFQKGTLFMVIGNEERATELIGEARDFSIKNNDSATLAVTYNTLSLLYKRSGNMDKAESMINKSIKINREIDNKYSLAAALGNLSQYHSKKGDFESALTCIKETLRLFEELDAKNEVARSLISVGELYLQQKEYNSYSKYIEDAEILIAEHNLLDAKIDLWAVKAEYEMSMHQYTKALEYFTEEYKLAQQFDISELELTSIENMYKSAKASGNHLLALEYLEEFKSLSDSLEEISGEEALIALELNEKFKHEKELAQIEKHDLITQKENADLAASKKNYLILSLILGALLIATGGLLLIRRKNIALHRKETEKEELTDELELKNKELVSSALQILRKTEEMKQTIESLQELNRKAKPEDSKILLSIIRKLKFELEHNSWDEFEVPFKQLHSSFYNNLVKKYPELTRAEIKVCSLLKLNMDTKQISAILHKTPASIEVDRSRIRKKMGLTNKKVSLSRHITTNI